MVQVNYWDYIKVEELLALQGGLDERDEGLANDEIFFYCRSSGSRTLVQDHPQRQALFARVAGGYAV
ncbi:hypothetical protein [Paracidovorax cattleyae]|uniref:hypothetical protein n=1 Tax=Paracidovorax cattleyae TaxID=80868 RepID=UPI001FC902EC|nr:hypothetical protein [Paracidovorax cattleyae]